MEDSIFTKIIKGEIPCHKVYEDDRVIAFLDIHPTTTGHVLVVPKSQIECVWDLDDEDYTALMQAVKKIAVHIREALGVQYVGSKIIGTDVPHAHVHLIPFNKSREFTVPRNLEGEPNHGELEKIAEKIRF